jgi:hypothetical protein
MLFGVRSNAPHHVVMIDRRRQSLAVDNAVNPVRGARVMRIEALADPVTRSSQQAAQETGSVTQLKKANARHAWSSKWSKEGLAIEQWRNPSRRVCRLNARRTT